MNDDVVSGGMVLRPENVTEAVPDEAPGLVPLVPGMHFVFLCGRELGRKKKKGKKKKKKVLKLLFAMKPSTVLKSISYLTSLG